MSNENLRTRTRGPSASSTSLKKTGAEAQAAHQREARRQEELRNRVFSPYRFYVPKPRKDKGETEVRGKYVILDSDIDQCPSFYEHSLPNPDNLTESGDQIRDKFEFCRKETEDCPACAIGDKSKYVQAISVINLRGYTNKRGENVSYTRQLLMVSHQQQGWFRRLCNEKLNGNMRGALVHAFRDGADMSYRIGVPDFQKQYSEAAIKKAFDNKEVRAKDGKLIKAAGADMFPFDYDEALPEKPAEQLRAELGGVSPAGSKAEVDAAWSRGQDQAQDQGQDQAQAQDLGQDQVTDGQATTDAPTTDEDELAGMVGVDDQPAARTRTRSRSATPAAAKKKFDDPDDEIPF